MRLLKKWLRLLHVLTSIAGVSFLASEVFQRFGSLKNLQVVGPTVYTLALLLLVGLWVFTSLVVVVCVLRVKALRDPEELASGLPPVRVVRRRS